MRPEAGSRGLRRAKESFSDFPEIERRSGGKLKKDSPEPPKLSLNPPG
jgi:hypothetical protein